GAARYVSPTAAGSACGRRWFLSEGVFHVLVLNQHGNNRGDEAAFRAMVAGIREQAPREVRFTVLHQGDSKSWEHIPEDIRFISLVPQPLEALRILLFAITLRLGPRWEGLLGGWGSAVVRAYSRADMAISAPGGPYFGDPYARHELLHWFY